MDLMRGAWCRFRMFDGFVSALILTVGLLLVVLPVLIVLFAMIEHLLGEHGSLATFFVKRLSLGRIPATILMDAFTPTDDTATAGALLGVVTFLFGGGSTISVVMLAYDRAISGNDPDSPRSSLWRGLGWFVFAGGFALLLFLPASTTGRFRPGPPMTALAAFGQTTVFFFVTGMWLPRRRPTWSAALLGALFAGSCVGLVVVTAWLTFAPLLGALGWVFGTFGVMLTLASLFYVLALVTMAAPCVTAAWMERRGHDPIVRRHDRRGSASGRGPEHWVRYSPDLVLRTVRWAAGSGFERLSRTFGWAVYKRYREVDGGNLAAALSLAAWMVILPASAAAVAVVLPMRRAATSFSDLLATLLFLRGDESAIGLLSEAVAPGTRSARWWGLALLTIVPFLPLLVVVAQRVFNRAWAPELGDVYDARRAILWAGGSGVLLLGSLMPLTGRHTGWFLLVAMSLRVLVFMLFTSLMLTLRRKGPKPQWPAVLFGSALFVAVSTVTGYTMGTWLEWYEDLLGPIGAPILLLTWASGLAVTVVLVPAFGAVLAERRAARIPTGTPSERAALRAGDSERG